MRALCLLICLSLVAALSAAEPLRPHPRLQQLGPNQALDLGRYECPTDEDRDESRCETITDYSGLVYHPGRHQLMLFGGGHAATYRDDVELFDLASLTWRSAYPPTPCEDRRLDNVDVEAGRWISSNHPIARHSYDLLAVAGEPAELFLFARVQGRGRGCHHLPEDKPYVIAEGRVAAYDPQARTWRYTATPALGFAFAAETDPVSGRVLLVDRRSLRTFDPASGRMTLQRKLGFPAMQAGRSLVYFPPLDRFYYMVQGGRARGEVLEGVYEIIPNRTNWSDSRIRRMKVESPGETGHAWAYDPVHELIGGGVHRGRFHAFDPRERRWYVSVIKTDSGHEVGAVSNYTLAFDPVNGVYVWRSDGPSGQRTWAYRWGYTPENQSFKGGRLGFSRAAGYSRSLN